MAVNAIAMTMQAAGFMDTILRSFRGLRLARSFSDDFNTCTIQLHLCCLRLSTWYRYRSSQVPHDGDRVLKSLEGINKTLDRAKEVYDDYVKEEPRGAQKHLEASYTVQDPACEVAFELRGRIQARIDEQDTAIRKSNIVPWLLYQREEFDNIVKTTTSLVDQLVTDFPVNNQIFKDERYELINSIPSSDQLRLLASASHNFDEGLHSAVLHEVSNTYDAEFIRTKATGQQGTVGLDFTRAGKVPEGKLPRMRFVDTEDSGVGNCTGSKF